MAKRRSKNPVDEDEICGCDFEFLEDEATLDEALPAASGGIAIEGEGDEICGCDLHFDDFDATPDEQLPAATGGVG